MMVMGKRLRAYKDIVELHNGLDRWSGQADRIELKSYSAIVVDRLPYQYWTGQESPNGMLSKFLLLSQKVYTPLNIHR